MPYPTKRFLALTVSALTLAGVAGPSAATAPAYEPPAPRTHVFPVARSDWYSVINFGDDWHAPRMRLIRGKWRQVGIHEGNDIFAEPGTPVRAVTGGVVERAGWLFYSGWRVGIRSDDGRYWFYAHMSESPRVAEGERVAAGQTIGKVGNTGYGSRPGHKDEFAAHLHLGIQEPSGEWVNPHPLVERLYEEALRS
jgi:murein DD-endopeptidase MepM/ murein hydrolase activator NlpD